MHKALTLYIYFNVQDTDSTETKQNNSTDIHQLIATASWLLFFTASRTIMKHNF